MKVLLTNDDGIGSPGLMALWEAIHPVAEVTIVAPTRERSGVGHGISMHDLHVYPWQMDAATGYAVHGTPADCVKVAIFDLMKARPDLVISGINRGLNYGIDAFYSGTVAAAREAAIRGIPGLALSVEAQEFARAAEFAVLLARQMDSLARPAGIMLNVNVPKNPTMGIRITRQSDGGFREEYHKEIDELGRGTYSVRGEHPPASDDLEFDYPAVRAGYVSVTPMHFDLTHYPSLNHLREILEDGEAVRRA
ncbi:MAG: 5'/3'-nucleotidase SurE [Planctomycetota bacterium]|nr:5'/3'-nucleotidase SurE [Planctomycetota bacterium]